VYSPHFDFCNIFSFNGKNHINKINVLVISILWFGEKAFQSSEKVDDFIWQDVSLYIQTFQVVSPKTILPFFAKRRKNCGTCFFVSGKIRSNIPK